MDRIIHIYDFIHSSIHGVNHDLISIIGVDIFVFSILILIIYSVPLLCWHYIEKLVHIMINMYKLLVQNFYILLKFIKELFCLLYIQLFIIISCGLIIIVWLFSLYIDPLDEYSHEKTIIPQSSIVYDNEGEVFDNIFKDFIRIWKPIKQIDNRLVQMVLFAEDDKFYKHPGFDFFEIFASIRKNITEGKFARGGSTITQQLTKNLFLSKKKTIKRKLSELALALKIESELNKEQIIELYMNLVEFGPGIYGAEAASRYYFDKTAENLTLSEIYFLTLILPGPKLFSPFYNPQRLKRLYKRKNSLIKRLYKQKKLTIDDLPLHRDLKFRFYPNRDPGNIFVKYPKADSVNIEEKNELFISLENYVNRIKEKENIYEHGYNIITSLNKKRHLEIYRNCFNINRKTDNNSDFKYVPVYKDGNIIAIGNLNNTKPATIKFFMKYLDKDEKLEKIYNIDSIPWSKIIKSINKIPVVTMKRNTR